MAKDWQGAQEAERVFWDDIYLHGKSDVETYMKISTEEAYRFLVKTLDRHGLTLDMLADQTVMDLGCGPYGLIKGIAESQEFDSSLKDTSICGVDPLMSHYSTYELIPSRDRVQLISSRGESVPLEDGSCDRIFCVNVIDHCESPAGLIKEARRLLSEGGEFHCSVHVLLNLYRPFSGLFKYIDKNHPHHFTDHSFRSELTRYFDSVEKTAEVSMVEDQPDFRFSRVLRSPSVLRGIKRASSNYIIYSAYYNCR